MSDEFSEIASATRVQLHEYREGDILVIHAKKPMPVDATRNYIDNLRTALGVTGKIVFVPHDVDLEVFRPAPAELETAANGQ